MDEFEWGLRIVNEPTDCPFHYLPEDAQADILRALDQVKLLEFPARDGPCVQEFVGEYYNEGA